MKRLLGNQLAELATEIGERSHGPFRGRRMDHRGGRRERKMKRDEKKKERKRKEKEKSMERERLRTAT